jgi:hypothetical protein
MFVKFGCVEDKAPLFLTRKLGQGLLQNGGRTAIAESLLLTVVDSGRAVPTLSGFRCIAAPDAQFAKAPVIKDVQGTPSERQAAEWRDGHYLLRSNLTAGGPSVLWARYVQRTQIESVFRSLKSELGIRPVYHQLEHRADAHILIAFLAYCFEITLKHRLLVHAPGVDAYGGVGEVGRDPNDRRLDSHRRSTLVNPAALHATFLRRQAAH